MPGTTAISRPASCRCERRSMNAADRATALQSLGYAPRQAAFLALVAVHGGYFLRRHYATFLTQPDGGVVTDLLRRVVDRGHAIRQTVARETHLYHLCSRPIYAVLGEHESRNRRPALPATIAVRLMTVDVVLGWRDRLVLATEAEKVRFFTEDWAIPRDRLPATIFRSTSPEVVPVVRYFVDRAPISMAPGSPEVTVAYVQGWSRGVGGFETWLTQYQPFFACLPAVRVLYCTTRPGLVELAHRAWVTVLGEPDHTARPRPTTQQFAAHFRIRRHLEHHGSKDVSQQELEQHLAEQARFSAPQWQALYARWCVAGDVVLESLRRPIVPARVGPPPRFEAFIMRRWYPLFPPTEARHDTHNAAA